MFANYNSATDRYLKLASAYAQINSGCNKVAVGSAIIKNGRIVALGANRAIPDFCKTIRGCLRLEKYGENDKTHRNPEDCRAIHSEIDAISKAGSDLTFATIYITRYPCEACARAIVAAGISTVVYGREQKISEETEAIFEHYGIRHHNYAKFKEDDVTN